MGTSFSNWNLWVTTDMQKYWPMTGTNLACLGRGDIPATFSLVRVDSLSKIKHFFTHTKAVGWNYLLGTFQSMTLLHIYLQLQKHMAQDLKFQNSPLGTLNRQWASVCVKRANMTCIIYRLYEYNTFQGFEQSTTRAANCIVLSKS